MKTFTTAFVLVLLVVGAACKNESSSSAESVSTHDTATTVTQSALTAEQLGELGAQIKKSPADAEKILSDHNLTQQSFEDQLRQVAQDPAASKRYAAAYKKAGA